MLVSSLCTIDTVMKDCGVFARGYFQQISDNSGFRLKIGQLLKGVMDIFAGQKSNNQAFPNHGGARLLGRYVYYAEYVSIC